MRKIIILTGPIGCGKGTVARILKKHGYHVITMGNFVREEAEKRGIKGTRENLGKINLELTKKYGIDYFIQKAIKKIEENRWKKVVVDGIRRPVGVDLFREKFDDSVRVILIDAKPRIRFERMKKRRRVGFPRTYEIFKEQERREYEIFNLSETFKKADVRITNNGTKEELEEKVEKLIKKWGWD